MEVEGDLCVARRRRCPCIAFSLLLDLAAQAPSANVTISMKRGTERTYWYVCAGQRSPLPAILQCHRSAVVAVRTSEFNNSIAEFGVGDVTVIKGTANRLSDPVAFQKIVQMQRLPGLFRIGLVPGKVSLAVRTADCNLQMWVRGFIDGLELKDLSTVGTARVFPSSEGPK